MYAVRRALLRAFRAPETRSRRVGGRGSGGKIALIAVILVPLIFERLIGTPRRRAVAIAPVGGARRARVAVFGISRIAARLFFCAEQRGKFADKPRLQRHRAFAVQIAALGTGEKQPFACAGDGDVHQPPLLFQFVGIDRRAGNGHDVLFQPRQKHRLEFQPLDRMDGGERHVFGLIHLVGVRTQSHLVQKVGKERVLVEFAEFVDGVDEFVDVRLFVDALVRIVGIHGKDAAVVDDVADEFVGAFVRALDDEVFQKIAERR